MWEVVSKEEVDAPDWRGFWDWVDLRLGAIEQTNTRKSERQSKKHQQNNI